MNTLLTILAQEGGSPVQNLLGSGFLFPIALIILFYFMLIRPQQKQKKEHEKRVAALKKGDKVVTNGGIHGYVNHKSERTCSLRIANDVFITMELSNISTVIPKGEAKAQEAEVVTEEK